MPNKNFYIYGGLLAFILGLLLTGIFTFYQWLYLCLFLSILLLIISLIFKNKNYLFIDFRYLFLWFLIAITAFLYYYWRFPTVGKFDISHQISDSFSNPIKVEGVILTTPRINQNHKAKFIFQAEELIDENSQRKKVTGKMYVTSALLEANGLFPSTVVSLEGNLYKPSPPLNPDGFDFADYLQRQGVFSGLSANSVEVIKKGNSWQDLLFNIRRRITQTHVRFLNIPSGSLVSSMVMGSRAVDLDLELQEAFRLAGLAHVLAASGFHVSLLLGVVLTVTQSFSPRNRLFIGIFTLFLYATITGFYPSILRACLMGVGVLVAMVSEKKVRVSGSLLLSAVILLLINPLWIKDIGFQLSFLATFGLIVSFNAIVERLDWMPPTLANLIAVPLAATIWTLPLQFYHFNRFPLYGIFTNVLATPLVIIITLGGILTALIGVFLPLLGSAIASLLFPFIWLLIELVEVSNKLPFSSFAVGRINEITLCLIYLIFIIVTYGKLREIYKYCLILFTVSLVTLPLVYQKLNLIQVTIIDSRIKPLVIVQNLNQTALINLGDKASVYYSLLPFLRSEGINRIELLLSDENNQNSSLDILQKYLSVENINNYQSNKIDAIDIIEDNKNYIYFKIKDKSFLVIKDEIDSLNIDNFIDFVIVTKDNFNERLLTNLKADLLLVKKSDSLPLLDNIKTLSIDNNFLQWRWNGSSFLKTTN